MRVHSNWKALTRLRVCTTNTTARSRPCFLSNGELPKRGRGAYLWLTQPLPADHTQQMPADAAAYAAILYQTLHRLDDRGFEWIAIERPPEWPEWTGVLDRLDRASSRL